MNVKERLLAIKLVQKEKKNPDLFKDIKIEVKQPVIKKQK